MEAVSMAQRARSHSSLFLLLLCACRADVQRFVNAEDHRVTKNGGMVYFDNKPYTGTLFTLYADTKDTAAISGYRQGREDGLWRKYYHNRQLREQRSYDNGRKTGLYTAWWEDGKQQLEYHFEQDEYEGVCREWNADGMLIKEMHYKKGHEDGSQKMFYDNGKVRANYTMIDGKRFGLLGTKNCVNVTDSIFKN